MGGAVDPADTEAPPTCPRHGTERQPITDHRYRNSIRFRCAECHREADRRYDDAHPGRRATRTQRLKERGMCVACGQEPAVTETRCGDCAIKLCEDAPRYRP